MVQRHPREPDGWLLVARCRRARRELGASLEAIDEAAALVPSDLRARLERIHTMLLGGDRSGSGELDRLIAARPDWAEPRVVRARFRIDAGRVADALEDLTAALQLDPADVEARLTVARLVMASDPRRALAEADEVGRRSVRRPEVGLVRVMARLQLGEKAAARKASDDLLAAAPRDARAWLARAALCLDADELPEVEEAATRSLGLDPECERRLARSYRAEGRLRAGRPAEALDDVMAVFLVQPDELLPWMLRARTLEALGRLEAATHDLEHALVMVGDRHPLAPRIRADLERLRARLAERR